MAATASHGQDAKNGPDGVGPGRFDEKTFMPERVAGVPRPKDGIEWYRSSAKSQSQLDWEAKKNGKEPLPAWTAEQYRDKRIQLHQLFPNHKAGDEDDEYAQHLKEWLDRSNVKQLKSGIPRIADSPAVDDEELTRKIKSPSPHDLFQHYE
uniref:Uncharacterized protein n=1 Tax=Bionectria ochroleuca TaxID=29856 RepID=A0A8H7N507_BIOOC